MVFLWFSLNPNEIQKKTRGSIRTADPGSQPKRHLAEMPRWNDGVHSASWTPQKKTWKITRGLCGLMMINGYEWWIHVPNHQPDDIRKW